MATNNAINAHGPSPIFFAYLSATTGGITGDGTGPNPFPFDATLYNVGGAYSTVTYLCTVPTTGTYLILTSLLLTGVSTKFNITTNIIGTACNLANTIYPAAITVGGDLLWTNNATQYLTAGTNFGINLVVASGPKNVTVVSGGANDPKSWLAAYLIG